MPSGVAVSVELDVATARAQFDEIIRRGADLAPMYALLYDAVRKMALVRFDKEGPGWAELAPSTQADRARRGYSPDHPILNRDGTLRRSLTTKGAKGAVFHPMVDGIFVGTSVSYAEYHQDGTKKMPARPLIAPSQADRDGFDAIVGDWLTSATSQGASLMSTSAGAI